MNQSSTVYDIITEGVMW